MKKIILSLIMLLLIPNIKSASFTTAISSSKTISNLQQFSLTFNVATTANLIGIQANLNYDSTKLTFVSASGSNGFTATVGTKIVADNTIGKSGTYSFVVLTFKATSSFFAGQNTTVSITNVIASDGSNDLTGVGSSATITMETPKSTNNNLSNLTINGSTIAGFNSSTLSYSLTLENNVTSVNIGAQVADSKATITGVGNKNLSDYLNSFSVVVKSESGASKTYTIKIYRKDKDGRVEALQTDNTLTSLLIEGYELEFNSLQDTYNLEVENNVTSLTIKATSSSKATFVINNVDELKVGSNTITVVVTAENGAIKTYTLNVIRKGDGFTTTLDKLIEVLEKITVTNINVTASDQYQISGEILQKIKEKNKNITINSFDKSGKLIYSWNITGSKVDNIDSINTEILFTSEYKKNILELSNYANGVHLNFQNEGKLPDDTIITLFVGDEYENDEVLNLYYYDKTNNKLDKINNNIIVNNGYVSFSIPHTSEYFLTKSLISSSNNLWIIIYSQSVIIGLFIIYFIYLNYKKRFNH